MKRLRVTWRSKPVISVLPRWQIAWRTKPIATTMPLAMVIVGILAVVLGDSASRAFDNLGGDIMIRVLGVALMIGGALATTGLVRNDSMVELFGLTLAALGAAIYGVGVILGLQTQGLIAGLGYLAIAVAFLGRIQLLLRAADSLRRDK